jgi:hypothetical protein
MKAISVGNALRWGPEVHAGDWMRFRTSNNKFSALTVEKAIWEFEDRYVLECHDGQEGLQILVKTLKSPTVELAADRRKKMCSLKLLSGRCIGSLPISEHERFTSLRERARGVLRQSGKYTDPECDCATFFSLGWCLKGKYLRRKVMKQLGRRKLRP